MEETKVKKREWVKTAAIIFLAVLLVLTFFSNTIMNASLPEVATARVENGSINAKIRGSGTVSANESYEVMLEQSHKVESVLVRVGQTVKVDDPLIMLEAKESAELKTEQDKLDQLQQTYDKALAEAANAASKTDREIEVARNAYNDALAVYNQYSMMSATELISAQARAKTELQSLKYEQERADQAVTDANSEYSKQQTRVSELKAEMETAKAELDKLTPVTEDLQRLIQQITVEIKELTEWINAHSYEEEELNKANTALNVAVNDSDYQYLLNVICGGNESAALVYAGNELSLTNYLMQERHMAATEATNLARVLCEKTNNVVNCKNKVREKENDFAMLLSKKSELTAKEQQKQAYEEALTQQATYQQALNKYNAAQSQYQMANSNLQAFEMQIKMLKDNASAAKMAVDDKNNQIQSMTDAATAAETVRTAKKALEDKLFEKTLTDTSSVDIKATAKSIEKQQQVVDKLLETADGGTVRSTVNGVVRSISVTAGQMANAQTSLMTVDVLDRGYIIKIPVETEQSKKVRIGDTAELVNWWGGSIITPTLETIEPDPENPTKKRLLVFRLEGEVEAGQNLTLAIGQKSANFDCLVPNSAVKTDNNGSFVLVITTKSTPLGNRYTATRVDVQELAKDDTKTAVTGLSNGDFVITTSSSPVEAGMQVRLPDNA